jgi:hypothetical protein
MTVSSPSPDAAKTTVVLVNESELNNLEKALAKAREWGTPIVSLAWLTECLRTALPQNPGSFLCATFCPSRFTIFAFGSFR